MPHRYFNDIDSKFLAIADKRIIPISAKEKFLRQEDEKLDAIVAANQDIVEQWDNEKRGRLRTKLMPKRNKANKLGSSGTDADCLMFKIQLICAHLTKKDKSWWMQEKMQKCAKQM